MAKKLASTAKSTKPKAVNRKGLGLMLGASAGLPYDYQDSNDINSDMAVFFPGSLSPGSNKTKEPVGYDSWLRYFKRNFAVSSCVSLIGESMLMNGWKLIEPDGIRGSQQNYDQLMDFFSTCHPYFTFEEVLREAFDNLALANRCYLEIVRDGTGRPVYLLDLPQGSIFPKVRSDGMFDEDEAFVQVLGGPWSRDKQTVPFAWKDILWLRFAGIRGKSVNPMSPVEMLEVPINTGISSQAYINSFFDSGGKIGLIVENERWDEAQAAEMLRYYNRMYTRSDKGHQIMVLYDGSTIHEPPKAWGEWAQFVDIQSFAGRQVCGVFKVDPKLISYASQGNLGGKGEREQVIEEFHINNINPKKAIISTAITKQIIEQGFGISDWQFQLIPFRTTVDATSRLTAANTYLTMLKAGLLDVTSPEDINRCRQQIDGDLPVLTPEQVKNLPPPVLPGHQAPDDSSQDAIANANPDKNAGGGFGDRSNGMTRNDHHRNSSKEAQETQDQEEARSIASQREEGNRSGASQNGEPQSTSRAQTSKETGLSDRYNPHHDDKGRFSTEDAAVLHTEKGSGIWSHPKAKRGPDMPRNPSTKTISHDQGMALAKGFATTAKQKSSVEKMKQFAKEAKDYAQHLDWSNATQGRDLLEKHIKSVESLDANHSQPYVKIGTDFDKNDKDNFYSHGGLEKLQKQWGTKRHNTNHDEKGRFATSPASSIASNVQSEKNLSEDESMDVADRMAAATEGQWNDLSVAEKAIVRGYCANLSGDINTAIGEAKGDESKLYKPAKLDDPWAEIFGDELGGASSSDDEKAITATISDLQSACLKCNTTEDAVLHRAFDVRAALGVDPQDAASLVGKEIVDHGFGSTSLNVNVAKNFLKGSSSRMMMRIDAPQGTKAVTICDAIGRATSRSEREILLPHSTKYQVTGYSDDPAGHGTLHVKIVSNAESRSSHFTRKSIVKSDGKFIAQYVQLVDDSRHPDTVNPAHHTGSKLGGTRRAPNGPIEERTPFADIETRMTNWQKSTVDALMDPIRRSIKKSADNLKQLFESDKGGAAKKLNGMNLLPGAGTVPNDFKKRMRSHLQDCRDDAKKELDKIAPNAKKTARTEKRDTADTGDVMDYIEQFGLDQFDQLYARVTSDQRKTFLKALQGGWDSDELTDELTGKVPDVAESILNTIVRTSGTDIFNLGRQQIAEESGVVTFYKYSAILDNRTSDVCKLADGLEIAIDRDEVEQIKPPCHWNCRSVLTFGLDGEDFKTDESQLSDVIEMIDEDFGGKP